MRVETVALGHEFGSTVVLRELDLNVEQGSSLAVFGANGSGKSTLLRCLAGLLRPTVGSARLAGRPAHDLPAAERARIGYLSHRPLVWGGLTARENLRLCAALYGVVSDGDRLLARVGLERRAEVLARSLSQGQRQRLAIARVLTPSPSLLLLDEPHAALDEDGVVLLDAILGELAGTVTLVLSTHERERGRALCATELTL